MPELPYVLPSRQLFLLVTRPRGGSPSQWDVKTVGTLAHCRNALTGAFAQPSPLIDYGLIEFAAGPFTLIDSSSPLVEPPAGPPLLNDWAMPDSPILYKCLNALTMEAIRRPFNQPQET